MKGVFGRPDRDEFRPEYGGIQWIHRLNGFLEAAGLEIEPVSYHEDRKPKMQITQENTMIFWNAIADELDAIAVMYDQDDGESTWYFREEIDNKTDIGFDELASRIGQWCLQTVSLYPMANVVDVYEARYKPEIPDELPDDWQ